MHAAKLVMGVRYHVHQISDFRQRVKTVPIQKAALFLGTGFA
jgi:hypothetical protein